MAQAKQPNIAVQNALVIYARLFQYVKRYWVALLIAGFASMIYSGVDAWFIYFLKPLLNKGLVAKNQNFLHSAPLLVMGVFILRGIASFFSNFYIASASRNVIMRLRQELFAHLQKLPATFYDQHTTGQILSVILYGVDQVANASADVLTTAIQSIFLLVGLIIVMVTISWKLTMLYFVLLPMVMIIMRIASTRIRRQSLKIQDSVAELSHLAEENIEGYKEVRTFAGETFEAKKFNAATKMNRDREMKVVIARSVSVSAVQLITAIALSLTLYIATLDIAESILTPGGFVAMVAAMLALLKPMKDLAFVQNKLFRGLAGAQKVFELFDQLPEEDTGTITLKRVRGKIDFKEVNFCYANGKPVLNNISLSIAPGEVVAIVGRSGSGKSTLISLLPRFYTRYTGSITLDDADIRDYRLQTLRQQIAIVSQSVTLFHDSIANNITYGQENVSQAELLAAAKAAHALEFIERLPEQFNAQIGENGVLLSGGQRQRLAIARAILKDAPILILDEATSALDTESERSIQAALESLMRSRTTLIIAHRLSTIEHADKIVVMDDGRIVEVGAHHELLAANGYYAKLHSMQFKESAVDTA